MSRQTLFLVAVIACGVLGVLLLWLALRSRQRDRPTSHRAEKTVGDAVARRHSARDELTPRWSPPRDEEAPAGPLSRRPPTVSGLPDTGYRPRRESRIAGAAFRPEPDPLTDPANPLSPLNPANTTGLFSGQPAEGPRHCSPDTSSAAHHAPTHHVPQHSAPAPMYDPPPVHHAPVHHDPGPTYSPPSPPDPGCYSS